jgi:hypothetical protein
MTDLAAEAALVAETLGGHVDERQPLALILPERGWSQVYNHHEWWWRGLVSLARELARWRELRPTIASLAGFADDWPEHGNAPLAIAASYALLLKERDRWRALALQHAPVVTGDQVVGGYGVASEEPDWRRAQRDFA